MSEKVVILDFGSQYTQLIARRLRELNVFCEIYPFNKFPENDALVKAVIFSGSPFSVLDSNALQIDLSKIINTYPVMAVCYGAQYVAHNTGGRVSKSNKREFGKAQLFQIENDDPIFKGIPQKSQVWMSHSDSIIEVPKNYSIIGRTDDIPVAIFRNMDFDASNGILPVYCLQFHPEVVHTTFGKVILENFIDLCGIKRDWTARSFIEESIQYLREQIGGSSVIMGLSGGVDSTVAATLLYRAIGSRLHCIFIDNGLLRKNEFHEVLDTYMRLGLPVTGIEAGQVFLDALRDIGDPEEKRKIIGRIFIETFEKEAKKVPNAGFLGQGTIYPDVIESVSVHGPSVTIKSHHNVGGLPETLKLKIVEPLRMLFKDEVRNVGLELGIPKEMIFRHPFPGPGLGIRILGPVSKEKVRLCQEADYIYIKNLKDSGWYEKVWQAGTILLPVQSVGVMGDERTYEFAVALRCVNSTDGMTAEWSPLPHALLARISSEIINNVKGINRVVYDISTKPPATIEWE